MKKHTRIFRLLLWFAIMSSVILGYTPGHYAEDGQTSKPTVEARLEAIEQKLLALERRLDEVLNVAQSIANATSASTPLSLDQRLAAIDQQIRRLEQQRTPETNVAAAPHNTQPVVTADEDGFSLGSANGDFQLRLGGLLQADGRFYFGDRQQPAANTFLLRRVRPIWEGTLLKHFAFRVMTDFGGGQAVLQDLYVDTLFWPQARFRVGKFKVPIGLERLQSSSDILFIERALPTALVPNRDVGVQLHGDLAGGAFSYAVGVFNGVVDGNSGDFDDRDGKDVAARAFAHPFKTSSIPLLHGLGVGLAASVGHQAGNATAPALPVYRSTGQQPFFRYHADGTMAGTTIANGRRLRISPQAYYYGGPFGLMTEYVSSSQEVRRAGAIAQIDNHAWHVSASYVLTGEKASFGGVNPHHSLDLQTGHYGAFEIAGRYSQLTVDREAFPIFANPQTAARRADAWGVGLNWYFNKNVKLMFNYEQTTFDGGAINRDRETEKAILSRLQFLF